MSEVLYEFKSRVQDDLRDWEEMPIATRIFIDPNRDQFWATVNGVIEVLTRAAAAPVVEIRWNQAGSLNGAYHATGTERVSA